MTFQEIQLKYEIDLSILTNYDYPICILLINLSHEIDFSHEKEMFN